jgi:hypothetical protein
MNQPDQRRVNALWRHAVVSWLRCQVLITVTKPNETVNPGTGLPAPGPYVREKPAPFHRSSFIV